MIQMEQLFGTTLIADAMPVSPDLTARVTAIDAGQDGAEPFRTIDWGSGRRGSASWPVEAQPVVAHIIALANRATHDVRSPGIAPDWTVALSMHVGHGHGAVPRCYQAFWTALYVIRSDGRGGDMLDIQDPRLPMVMGEDPDLRLRDLGAKTPSCYQPTVEIALAAGMMFLFPSWLDVRYVSRRLDGAGFAFLRAGLIAPLP